MSSSAPAPGKGNPSAKSKSAGSAPGAAAAGGAGKTKGAAAADSAESAGTAAAAAAAAKPSKPAKPGKGGAAAADRPVDVSRLELRVGLITKAEKHPNADSLYVESIDCGEAAPRVVVSGLVHHIPEAEMQNRRVVVVANLKPTNLKSVKSFAMVLAATGADGKVRRRRALATKGHDHEFHQYTHFARGTLNPYKQSTGGARINLQVYQSPGGARMGTAGDEQRVLVVAVAPLKVGKLLLNDHPSSPNNTSFDQLRSERRAPAITGQLPHSTGGAACVAGGTSRPTAGQRSRRPRHRCRL